MSPEFDYQAWQENAGAEWRARERARRAVTNRLARGIVAAGVGLLGLFTPEQPSVAWRITGIVSVVAGSEEVVRAIVAHRRRDVSGPTVGAGPTAGAGPWRGQGMRS